MNKRERRIRNMLARIFDPYYHGGPNAWEACDIPGRERIEQAVKALARIDKETAHEAK